ncbi:class I SAM-dependent methyltransferase [Saccharothrix sp. S26]|uniref:class I SAM-dependent methyltransferase n=1 Tax=Saccharothrix sp. S26 TaxID=2907215 RepID=UPI001F36937D|nr:class I SAM-dependent methyltransferase [Saccharothrix sp. S26]MCE6995351.1 class I SAM-dependent methyltransferase [Saccharothrix sp. S26]
MDQLGLDEIERLIGAADAGDDELRGTISDLGAARVARLLVEEIVFRADPANVHRTFDVVLELTGTQPLSYVFQVRPDGRIEHSEGTSENAVHVITYDIADLVRDVFGTVRTPRPVRRAIRSRFEESHDAAADRGLLESVLYSQRATAAVLSGVDAPAPDLGHLSARYLSDKWGGLHWFTPHYEWHLAGRRHERLRILDIGVGGFEGRDTGGGSMLMWRRYFPRAVIFGMDIFDKSGLDQPRIKTLRGDQNDEEWLDRVATEHGPFDIVIDDGSHVNEHVRTSFGVLFEKHLRPGGIYVIEDMWTSYCPGYGGDDAAEAGPATSVGLIKQLVDALHHEEHHVAAGVADGGVASWVTGLSVYRNLAFISKGVNIDGGIPRFIPRRGLA